jgi:hypothetical protein
MPHKEWRILNGKITGWKFLFRADANATKMGGSQKRKWLFTAIFFFKQRISLMI